MPPISSTERQKLLLQQEIAKLSGAITRHATQPATTSYHPYRPSRGSYRGRGSRGHGRGRGGSHSYSLDLRNTSQPPSSSSTAANDSQAASSGSSTAAAGSAEREAGEVNDQPEASGSNTPTLMGKEPAQDWVKGTSRGGNMSLMTVEKSQHLKSLPAKPRIKKTRGVPPNIQVLTSTATSEGTQRVVIDGVIFQFEPGGSKLTRIGEVAVASSNQSTPTRKKLAFGGKQYRRTSKGNLVTAAARADASKKPCRYYTKTGRCNRALTCPYLHDPNRLAICPKFLRGTCEHTDSSCPLSHTPSAHNTPSCVHFQATSTCRNGPTCPYPHVRVSPSAPVCEAFARGGWCDLPEGTCPELHVWECGAWRSTGKCSRGAKCGLRHVLRAEKGKSAASAEEAKRDGLDSDAVLGVNDVETPIPDEVDPLAFEHGTEFIGFGGDGGQGLPGAISDSDEEEHDEADADPSGSDDSDSDDSSDGNGAGSFSRSTKARSSSALGQGEPVANPHSASEDDSMEASEEEDADSEDEVLDVVS